jgi:adenosine deaminase/aminodeoxyfutalosine deaminase
MTSIEQYIASLPKAELHLHLEGCVDADTLWELAVRQNSPLVAQGRAALNDADSIIDFRGFADAWSRARRHLLESADFELATYRTLQSLAAQCVRYAEITFGAGVTLRVGQELRAMFAGMQAGAARAAAESGIRVQWIFDAVRQWTIEEGWQTVRASADLLQQGVVAFGLGGDEVRGPAEPFREIFSFARNRGMRLHVHAGECAGPESIWSALNDLGAERIGHGLTAIHDPRLVQHLVDTQIPVEICLTSNLRTGGITELSQHPLRKYFDAGVNVSLHTDDPALFGTSLNREYLLAHQVFRFTRDELRQLAMNSFHSAFLPDEEKERYLKEFSSEHP